MNRSDYNLFELYHHGIKGQKWGVRRFQNKDGTLTRAGQLRIKSKEALRDYSKKTREYDDIEEADNEVGGMSQALRREKARAQAALDESRLNYTKTQNAYKYEKALEKGAKEKKLRRIDERNASWEATLEAEAKLSKVIADAYAEQSTSRLAGERVVSELFGISGALSNVPVAALKHVGYTEEGARYYSVLHGEEAAIARAYSEMHRKAYENFQKTYDYDRRHGKNDNRDDKDKR